MTTDWGIVLYCDTIRWALIRDTFASNDVKMEHLLLSSKEDLNSKLIRIELQFGFSKTVLILILLVSFLYSTAIC